MIKKYCRIAVFLILFISSGFYCYTRDANGASTSREARVNQFIANTSTSNLSSRPTAVARINNLVNHNVIGATSNSSYNNYHISNISAPQMTAATNPNNRLSGSTAWQGLNLRPIDVANVQYGTSNQTRGDLWIPPNHSASSEPLPVVVLVHGGGFVGGDKSDLNSAAGYLALRQGYAVFNINYTLLGTDSSGDFQGGYQSSVEEAHQAVNWLQQNEDTYNIDSNNIVVVGCSAGAATATGLATTYPEDIDGVVAYSPTVDLREGFQREPQAVIETMASSRGMNKSELKEYLKENYDGTKAGTLNNIYQDSEEDLKDQSPINNISGETPPTLIFYGDAADSPSLINSGENFADDLNAAGGQGETVVIDGGPHGENLMNSPDTSSQALEFLDEILQ